MKAKGHIGIDFDNTIVTYDRVFHKYALMAGLITTDVKKNKQAVRDAVRLLPKGNDKWTELQGLVYGKYMDEAEIMEGVEDFLNSCKKNSIKVSIISHKTVYPAMGPRINLQAAAKNWLENNDLLSKFGLTKDDIVFEETLNGKLARIISKGCTHFIDDLEEVLSHPDFPKGVKKILYAARIDGDLAKDIMHFKDWDEIEKYFFS